jgi:4-amino-4-deoxy-L-arabinose transferase-like glycosyltransferase
MPPPESRRIFRLALCTAILVAAASAWLGHQVFGSVPHVADGVSYAFQGQIFAAGHPWLRPPAVPEAFEAQNVLLNETRWCGIYPPGFPALLALGWLLKAPHLVNPLLLGFAIFGVYRLGSILYDHRTGLLGALLLAVSPFALLMGGDFMGHVASLSVFMWCLVFLAKAALEDGAVPLLLAGLLGGFGVVVRPQAAVLFLAPAALALLAVRRQSPRRIVGLLALGAALPVALLFAYNISLSGNPLRMAYIVWDPNLPFTEGLSLFQLLSVHVPWFLRDLSASVWGYPWGDLSLLFILAIPGAKQRRHDAVLGACALALVLGFSCYRFYDVSHSGPRYAFEALGVLALLTARALQTAARLARSLGDRTGRSRIAPIAIVAAGGFLVAFPLARQLPQRAAALSHSYHGHLNQPLRSLAEAGVGRSALVLVSGNTVGFTFGSFLLENGADPRTAPRVFARDLPSKRAELLAAYPREETWSLAITLRPLELQYDWIENIWDVVEVRWKRLR